MTITKTRTDIRPTETLEQGCSLIASDKIEGTTLFAKDGAKLGTVRKVMIDPENGNVRHVVIGYGGLFGMGEDHYPMPFDAISFDRAKEAYVLAVDKDRINAEKAPSFAADQQPRWDDKYEREVRLWYFPTS